MSVPSDKFTFFYLIFAICLGAGPACAEPNKGSSHMVEVGDGVSLRVIEAGKPNDVPALLFYPWLEHGRGYLAASNRHIRQNPSRHHVRSPFSRRIGNSNKR